MTFHGDYEIEFEIYETRDGTNHFELLGHMPGMDAEDARLRWAEANHLSLEEEIKIVAVAPVRL